MRNDDNAAAIFLHVQWIASRLVLVSIHIIIYDIFCVAYNSKTPGKPGKINIHYNNMQSQCDIREHFFA